MIVHNAPEGFNAKVARNTDVLIHCKDDIDMKLEMFQHIGADEDKDSLLYYTVLSWYIEASKDQDDYDCYIYFWTSKGVMTILLETGFSYKILLRLMNTVETFEFTPLDEIFKFVKRSDREVLNKDLKFMLNSIDVAFTRSFCLQTLEDKDQFFECTFRALNMFVIGFNLVDEEGNFDVSKFGLHALLVWECIFQFSANNKSKFTQEFNQGFEYVNKELEARLANKAVFSQFSRETLEKQLCINEYKRIHALIQRFDSIEEMPNKMRKYIINAIKDNKDHANVLKMYKKYREFKNSGKMERGYLEFPPITSE